MTSQSFKDFYDQLLAKKAILELSNTAEVDASLCHSDQKLTNTDEADGILRQLVTSDLLGIDTELAVSGSGQIDKPTKTDEDIMELKPLCSNLIEYLSQSSSLHDESDIDSTRVLRDGFALEEKAADPMLSVVITENQSLSACFSEENESWDELCHGAATATQLRQSSSILELSDEQLGSLTGTSVIARDRMPDTSSLLYAHCQMYRNTETSRTTSKWVLKMRVAATLDLTSERPKLVEYYVSFGAGGPRRLKPKIKDWTKKGMLSAEFANRFEDIARPMHANAWMGLVSASAVAGPKSVKGQSSKARLVYDDQFAMLCLNADGSPGCVYLWLGNGQAPLVIADWKCADKRRKDGAIRSDHAAAYYAYYDPDGAMRKLRLDGALLAKYNAKQADLDEQHPINVIAANITKALNERLDKQQLIIDQQQETIDRHEEINQEFYNWQCELACMLKSANEQIAILLAAKL